MQFSNKFSEEDRILLANYVSNLDDNIYLIYNLPPEVKAVVFAYVSRSPLGFRENILKLLKQPEIDHLIKSHSLEALDYKEASEIAKKFHERWVIKYGHSSLAEHANCSIAFEDVSIIASKVIEDNRLASYTEKSTRYQLFERDKYYKPKKIMESRFSSLYERTCNNLFDSYVELTPAMIDFIKEKYPIEKEMNEKSYESISRAKACDNLRYLLPASTLTNIAMTANARTLEHAITKMLSNPLEEIQEIGKKLKEEVTKLMPILVKYADYNKYIANTNNKMYAICKEFSDESKNKKNVKLVDFDRNAEEKLIATILYRYSNDSFENLIKKSKKLQKKQKQMIIDEFLNELEKYDVPLRELEHINYTFDILIDYGAFRDLQRHRICTQTNQLLTTKHGYSIPKEIIEANLKDEFINAMQGAKEAFDSILGEFPLEAQYVVPLAYNKRVLITLNLRELMHIIKLRSKKEGHISYRRIAWQLYDELAKTHPFIAKYISCDKSL